MLSHLKFSIRAKFRRAAVRVDSARTGWHQPPRPIVPPSPIHTTNNGFNEIKHLLLLQISTRAESLQHNPLIKITTEMDPHQQMKCQYCTNIVNGQLEIALNTIFTTHVG